MKTADRSMSIRVARHFRNRLVSGVLVLVPLAITLFILNILFSALTGFILPLLRPFLEDMPEAVLTLIALLAGILTVYLVGLVTTHIIGRRFIHLGESIIMRLPIVRSIYSASKQVVDTFSAGNKDAFKAVVVVPFPHADSLALGFVTGTILDAGQRLLYRIFVPTTPNPTSGFLLLLPAGTVQFTNISVEDGIKMIVSGGVLSPAQFEGAPPPAIQPGSGAPG
jgi:uncharacterized membrane protein